MTRSLGLLLLLGLTACGQQQTEMEIEQSVQANALASNHIEWETSEVHPTKLFSTWLFERRSSEDVCAALLTRTADELTLFENEMTKPEHAGLVADCKEILLAKVSGYWDQQLASDGGPMPLNFRFNPVLEERDFSNGYDTIYADLKPRQVLLTFDDGPHPSNTSPILNTLNRTNATGIFFHVGKNVRSYPKLVKRVAAEGHGVGSHSVSHKCLAPTDACRKNNGYALTLKEAVQEITGAHRAIQEVLGYVDPFFRFPYGASSPALKKYLADRGIGSFFWSVDSLDWKKQPPAQVVRTVMNAVRKQGRGHILLHDIQTRTAQALPALLKELYFAGYTPVILRPMGEDRRQQPVEPGPLPTPQAKEQPQAPVAKASSQDSRDEVMPPPPMRKPTPEEREKDRQTAKKPRPKKRAPQKRPPQWPRWLRF